jgi:hypothetical protein
LNKIRHRSDGLYTGVFRPLAAHLAAVLVVSQNFHAMALEQLGPVKAHLADTHDSDLLKGHDFLLYQATVELGGVAGALAPPLYDTSTHVFKAISGLADFPMRTIRMPMKLESDMSKKT